MEPALRTRSTGPRDADPVGRFRSVPPTVADGSPDHRGSNFGTLEHERSDTGPTR
ncbi:hypothetical protein JOJ87_002105 [Rhodococcus ruber]|nr:hypothetical protein [Rhodococcus ruber]